MLCQAKLENMQSGEFKSKIMSSRSQEKMHTIYGGTVRSQIEK